MEDLPFGFLLLIFSLEALFKCVDWGRSYWGDIVLLESRGVRLRVKSPLKIFSFRRAQDCGCVTSPCILLVQDNQSSLKNLKEESTSYFQHAITCQHTSVTDYHVNAQSDWLHRCRQSIDRRQFVRARAIQHASMHKCIKLYEIKIFFCQIDRSLRYA